MRWLFQPRTGVGAFWLFLVAALALARVRAEEAGPADGRWPEYPLYSPYFGRPHRFSAEETERLAHGFEMVFGQLPDRALMDDVRRQNPRFRFLVHSAAATVRSSFAERELRRQILYTPIAMLVGPLSARSASFKLAPLPGASRIVLRASNMEGNESFDTRRSVVWVRVDDELMRVQSFDPETGRVEVARNFDGCNLQNHASDAVVFCPVYSIPAGGSRDWEVGQPLMYHYDPAYPARWNRILDELIEATGNGADGLWIDLHLDRYSRETDLNGHELKAPSEEQSPCWNFIAGRYYLKDELRKRNEDGLLVVREKYRARAGKDPLLFGNHLMAARAVEGAGGHGHYLLASGGKPAALDGIGIEEFMGGYSMEEWLLWVHSRRVAAPRKAGLSSNAPYRVWTDNLRLLARCAQSGQTAMPFILNASSRAAIFEELGRKERHEWELWAYASYLLAVEKTGGKCPTLFGVPMFYREDGRRVVDLDPMYYWPVGSPAETRKPEDFEGYSTPGTGVYRRRFTQGLVLVNPTAASQRIALGRSYYDPESGGAVTEVRLAEQSGRILLLRPPR